MTLLAQAPLPVPDGVAPTTIIGAFIFVTLSLMSVLVWVIRHVFVTTIPSVIATGEAKHNLVVTEQRAQRECYERNLDAMCKTFAAEGAAERKQCADQFMSMTATLVGLTAALAEERQAIVAAVKQHVTEQAMAYRHELYDKLNTAVLGRDLALAEKRAREKDDDRKRRGDPPA